MSGKFSQMAVLPRDGCFMHLPHINNNVDIEMSCSCYKLLVVLLFVYLQLSKESQSFGGYFVVLVVTF